MSFAPGSGMKTGGHDAQRVGAFRCRFQNHLPHQELCHGTAHDVPKTDKKKRLCARGRHERIHAAKPKQIEQPQLSIDPTGPRTKPENDAPLLQQKIGNELPQYIFNHCRLDLLVMKIRLGGAPLRSPRYTWTPVHIPDCTSGHPMRTRSPQLIPDQAATSNYRQLLSAQKAY